MIVRITTGARSAIRFHSKAVPQDVATLRHDLRNGPHHCFGDRSNCRLGGFCRHVSQDSTGRDNNKSMIVRYNITIIT